MGIQFSLIYQQLLPKVCGCFYHSTEIFCPMVIHVNWFKNDNVSHKPWSMHEFNSKLKVGNSSDPGKRSLPETKQNYFFYYKVYKLKIYIINYYYYYCIECYSFTAYEHISEACSRFKAIESNDLSWVVEFLKKMCIITIPAIIDTWWRDIRRGYTFRRHSWFSSFFEQL